MGSRGRRGISGTEQLAIGFEAFPGLALASGLLAPGGVAGDWREPGARWPGGEQLALFAGGLAALAAPVLAAGGG